MKFFGGFKSLTIFAKNSTQDIWQGSEYAFDIYSTPQRKHNMKFSKGTFERSERKHKRNESDERNAGTWVRILSLMHSWEGIEATARNITTNEALAQVLSSNFCEIFKNNLFIEHLQATVFKEMKLLQLICKYSIKQNFYIKFLFLELLNMI